MSKMLFLCGTSIVGVVLHIKIKILNFGNMCPNWKRGERNGTSKATIYLYFLYKY